MFNCSIVFGFYAEITRSKSTRRGQGKTQTMETKVSLFLSIRRGNYLISIKLLHFRFLNE